MGKVDYDGQLHTVYAAGREMPPEALDTWTRPSPATCRPAAR